MVRQPQQARHGAQCQRLAGVLVHLAFEAVVVQLFQLADFVAGACVDVGAGPDRHAVAVVQNDAFTHRAAGHRADRLSAQACALHRLADALAGQLPVAAEVKLHRAGHARHRQVLPLRLAVRDLVTRQIEDHRANAARSCVQRHQVVIHSLCSQGEEC